MDVARKYGIPSSTLSTIYKNRDRILKFARAGTEPSRKRMKPGKFPQLEEEIWKWILSISGQNSTLSGTTIRKRAQWLAEQQDYPDFQASVGWLEKFRTRHNLKTVKKKIVLPSGSSPFPDSLAVEEFILPGHSPMKDVFQRSTSPDHPISDIAIKQEPVLPEEYDWNLPTADPPPNSDSALSKLLTGVQRQSEPSSKDTMSGEVVRRSFNGTSKNRTTKRLSPCRSPELEPTFVNQLERWIPKDKCERTNPSNASIVENRSEMCKNSDNLSVDHLADHSKDQLECFGNYIVSKLKQMDAITCVLVQKAINDIIFEAEIKTLETQK